MVDEAEYDVALPRKKHSDLNIAEKQETNVLDVLEIMSTCIFIFTFFFFYGSSIL